MEHKRIQQALESVKPALDYTVLAMNEDRQHDLKKYTDKDGRPQNDSAYAAACAYYSTILCLETLAVIDLDPAELFQKCVNAGAIKEHNAYINSYEKIAAVAGVKVKKWVSKNIAGNEQVMRDLLRSGVPLVIYIGAPNDLNHVEACFGFMTTAEENLFFVQDPGYQKDTHIAGDLGMFRFDGEKRIPSVWKKPPVPRKAYKFGYFET